MNRACIAAARPLVSGAALRFDGQIAVFDARDAASPCYHCLFGEGDALEETRCATMGVFAPLVGIVGATQAAEALKLIAGIGESLAGRLLLLDALVDAMARTARAARPRMSGMPGSVMASAPAALRAAVSCTMKTISSGVLVVAMSIVALSEAATAAGMLPQAYAEGVVRAADQPTHAEREWAAIRGVITEQLAALKRGDAARAFAFATQGIREQFQDPDTFLAMVRGGYAALLDARYTMFLEGAIIDGNTIQPLRLVMPDDTVLVALYQLQMEADGRWHIAGCVIAPSTVKAA